WGKFNLREFVFKRVLAKAPPRQLQAALKNLHGALHMMYRGLIKRPDHPKKIRRKSIKKPAITDICQYHSENSRGYSPKGCASFHYR
ncbi:MAG: hypothetical protein R3C41_15270, partial [Calditrichia bacterium]